jgi:hypothetical protein
VPCRMACNHGENAGSRCASGGAGAIHSAAMKLRLALAAVWWTACVRSAPPLATPERPRVPSMAVMAPIVRELARETAAIRGLAFVREVPLRVETQAEVLAHQRAEREAPSKPGDAEVLESRVATALGIVPEGVDLGDAIARLVGAEAQGYYDPDEAVLVLTESEAAALPAPGPAGIEARATVVHELTHALQHQHFPGRVLAGRVQPPDLSDAARARLALLEGDATVVAMEWAARRRGHPILGTSELVPRVERWAEGAQVLTEADVPTYLAASAEVPYELGAVGVARMYAMGAWARVNEALGDASLRTASVLHPERAAVAFVAVDPPRDEALEAAGMRRAETRSLGEVELLLLLERAMRRERAAALAASWRGDGFSLYEGGGRVAARWTVSLASAADAAEVCARLAVTVARLRREGCPSVAGGTATGCPVELRAEGERLVLRRGS